MAAVGRERRGTEGFCGSTGLGGCADAESRPGRRPMTTGDKQPRGTSAVIAGSTRNPCTDNYLVSGISSNQFPVAGEMVGGKAAHGRTAPRGHVAPRHPAVPSGNLGWLFLRPVRENALRSFVAAFRQLSQVSLRTQDAIRLRLLVHPAGPQKQPPQATCPDCEEQSNRTRLCFVVRGLESHNSSALSLRA